MSKEPIAITADDVKEATDVLEPQYRARMRAIKSTNELYTQLQSLIAGLPSDAMKCVIELEVGHMPIVTVTQHAKAGSALQPTTKYKIEPLDD